MNFNIIEGGQPTFLEKYQKFLELYHNPKILKKDIPRILDWSMRQYTNARKKAIKDGKIQDNKPKYYHWRQSQKRWIVSRRNTIYVTCYTEEEAIQLVDYLKENGWTRENVEQFKKKRKWFNCS